MRLLEAIIDANHRALSGDANAGLHPADFAEELPMVALTCIDVRLNAILPQVLGVPPEQFIWLRNAGNIITGPMSSTMRSLALACAVKGGREVTIIGHTDCQVGKTSTMQLLEALRGLGVERHLLPDNINEFFGMFGSERANVIKAAGIARGSPLLGPKIPVHGLMVDIETGKLDWIVNGYETPQTMSGRWNEAVQSAGHSVDALRSLADFKIGEMKFPETKIGEIVTNVAETVAQKIRDMEVKPAAAPPPAPAPAAPPKIPLPPPLRPKVTLRRGPK
jgi:carbonic anhydrase